MAKESPTQKYQKLLDSAKHARQPFERDAYLNLAFYLNEQYVQWDDKGNNIARIPKPSRDTPRPIVNKIMHYIRTAHAEALQDKPQGDVLPPTDDISDISDSLVAKAYIDHVSGHENANYDRQLANATLWALLTPSGFLKWMWNDRLKRLDILPVPFFDLYIDPYARDWTKVRYIIHSQFMDIEQVYEAWGVEIKANETEQADPTRSSLLRGMGSAPAVSGVTVNELWYKPCRRYPKGHYVVWCRDKLLVPPRDLPYKFCMEDNMLPFTQLGTIERPDSIYYQSPVTYLRPAQMELNAWHAQRIAIRKKFSNPKWWIPAELELEADPNDDPAQILRGSGIGGQKPELIQPTTFPPNDDGEIIEQQMMHTVGQHEVSQAQVPGRVEAAKAIELLKESDAGALTTLRDTIAASNTQGWYMALELAREFETEEVMVAAYSKEGVPEVKHFRAGDLKPGFRIRTNMTTGLGRSRTARIDNIYRLIELGVLRDPEEIASALELPMGHVASYKAMDVRQARNENLEMQQDHAVTPNSWDEHAVHLREHNQFRKSHDYLVASQDVKQKFEFHCSTHEEMLDAQVAKQAQQMMQAQTLAGGAGGGKPIQPQPDPGAGGE